ncbi:MAG: hypothetical protein Q9195_004620 [Heterodermia aff. obscurata]
MVLVRLRDLGKKVAVVESKGRLGGHTETYTDPVSGGKIDIGVMVWHNSDFVRNYFARFDVPLALANLDTPPGVTGESVDFSTGKVATDYVPANATAGLAAYAAQLAQYPYLVTNPGKLPQPVPADLLLSFGDFVKKYPAVGDSVFIISRFVGGYGNILRLPMLNIFRSFTPGLLQSLQLGFLTTARHDNSELYDKFTTELGKDGFLNSRVVATDRSQPGHVKLIIKTPNGPKLFRAKKLVLTIPPVLNNLYGFDLDQNEISIFKEFKYKSYYAAVLNNSGVPDTLSLGNVGASTPFNLPVLPAAYGISPSRVPGLKAIQIGANDGQYLTEQQALDVVTAEIKRLQAAGTIPKATPGQPAPSFSVFSSHTPFELYLEAKDVAAGLYNRQFELQGKKNTWWTGAAFSTHDSSEIWEYTEGLIKDIAA